VLLVDDHRMMRAGLRSLLETGAGIEVVGEASSGHAALSLARSLLPDIVVMDVAMPGMSGIEATRLIRAENGRMRVIAISTYSEQSYVDSMRGAGACDYVLKSEAHDKLLPAVFAASAARTRPGPRTGTRAGTAADASYPWKKLLAEPGLCGHIVQLYQDEEFYCEAISHFAAEGLKRNEAVILVPTAPHREILSARLEDAGFDVEDLVLRGWLMFLDADETLPKFLVGGLPDAERFKALARKAIATARSNGRVCVRWWGEMVNVLYVAGNRRGSTRLEELFDEVAHEEAIAIFCSFLMDKFDAAIYDGPLGDVCRTHAHLIPARDYGLHEECVDRALTEVVGRAESLLLHSLADAAHGLCAAMPDSQAVLLRLRAARPDRFREVLDLARKHERTRLLT
jgi:CheY-like chemotaxis protein